MANTTNLNLVKLSGSEKLKTYPTNQASNMDTIDSAFGAGFGVSGKPTVNAELNSLADGLAIISNNNTHAAITAGQFVYVRGHGSLSDGLYVATSNISANGTLSGSNLTADTAGGLNSVYSSLNSKMLDIGTVTTGTTDTLDVPSGAYTTIRSLTIGKGTFVVYGGFEFSSSFTDTVVGRLLMNGSAIYGTYVRGNGNGGGGMNMSCIVESSTDQTTIALSVYQGSSSSKTIASLQLRAVRISA